MSTIKSCKFAKDAWDKLASMYQVKNEARVLALTNQLKELKMEEGQTIAERIAKITDLRDQLAGVDEEIEDRKLVTITLNSLAPSFGTFVTSLSIMLRSAPVSFDELVGLLLQEEERTSNFAHSSRQGEQVLAMQGKGKFQSKGGNF